MADRTSGRLNLPTELWTDIYKQMDANRDRLCKCTQYSSRFHTDPVHATALAATARELRSICGDVGLCYISSANMVWIGQAQLLKSAWIHSILENTKRVIISTSVASSRIPLGVLRFLRPEVVVIRSTYEEGNSYGEDADSDDDDYNDHASAIEVVRNIHAERVHTVEVFGWSYIRPAICTLLQNAASSLTSLMWSPTLPLMPSWNTESYPVHLSNLKTLKITGVCTNKSMEVLRQWTRSSALLEVTFRPSAAHADYEVDGMLPRFQAYGLTVRHFTCTKWISTYEPFFPHLKSMQCHDLNSCNSLPDSLQRITANMLIHRQDRLCRRLALPHWCPNLQHIHLIRVDPNIDDGEMKLDELRELCSGRGINLRISSFEW